MFQGPLVRGSPARVYPEHLQHSGYSLAYVRHPSATSQFLPIMAAGFRCASYSLVLRLVAALLLLWSYTLSACALATVLRPHTSQRRGGVPTDSCMELRPGIMDGISPADPKSIFTEVYHTSRIIHERSNCEAVKPVKRQTQRRLSCTHSHSFAICGTHKASVGCWPDWSLLIRGKKKWRPRHCGSICCYPVITYILGKRINYIWEKHR